MSKLVSLSDSAYETLKKKKIGNESFSDVVLRELGNKKKQDIMKFAGCLKSNDWNEVEKEIERIRKTAKMRDFQ